LILNILKIAYSEMIVERGSCLPNSEQSILPLQLIKSVGNIEAVRRLQNTQQPIKSTVRNKFRSMTILYVNIFETD
jgi:hypothetical protein